MKITRSILNLCFFVLIGVFAISCSNANNLNESSENGNAEVGMGELYFNFGSSGASRTAYPLDEIQPKVTSYQLVIYNSTNKYNETFSLTAEKKLILNEGTYNAVILAESSSIVYGSGYAKDIVIESNKATTVTFTLRPFDMSLTCPSEVECGKTFEVNYKFDTRNELLAFNNLQIGANNVTGMDKSISTFSSSYIPTGSNMSITIYMTCVEGTYTLSAPATAKESVLYLKNAYLGICDKTYNYSLSIYLPNMGNMIPYGTTFSLMPTTSASLKNLTWCPVNFIAPENASTSGLNVNIEWEQ